MIEEVWRPCYGFEGHYLISNTGKVWSLHLNKEMAQQWHKTKSWRIRFCVNKIKSPHSVHRLVAKTFLPNPDNLPEVNHKDGSRANNFLWNLEWCSKLQNTKHAVETGLIDNPFGVAARHYTGEVQVVKNGEHILSLFGNKDMLEKGFDFRLVSATLMGKQKTHRGCTFIKIFRGNEQ